MTRKSDLLKLADSVCTCYQDAGARLSGAVTGEEHAQAVGLLRQCEAKRTLLEAWIVELCGIDPGEVITIGGKP